MSDHASVFERMLWRTCCTDNGSLLEQGIRFVLHHVSSCLDLTSIYILQCGGFSPLFLKLGVTFCQQDYSEIFFFVCLHTFSNVILISLQCVLPFSVLQRLCERIS